MASTYRNFFYNDSLTGQTRSAMHFAAFRGDLHTLHSLIREGQNVNRRTVDGVTPLHEACARGHYYSVKMLLENGAEVDASNIDGSTPLCDACVSGDVECVRILMKYGAKVNPPLTRSTPLHEAALRNNVDALGILLEAGAKLDVHDGHFGTALHAACFRGNVESTRLLLNAGASVNATKLHRGALHLAATINNPDLIQLLIEHGADTKQKNNRGQLPKDFTTPDSEAALMFREYETKPMTLAALCRISLLRFLKPGEARFLHRIGIPKLLVDYLLHLA